MGFQSALFVVLDMKASCLVRLRDLGLAPGLMRKLFLLNDSEMFFFAYLFE